MATITTQGQANTRAGGPDPVESPASSRPQEPVKWTKNEEDGIFSGGGLKHYGDRQPKVRVATYQEAEDLLRAVANDAKISKGVAKSQQDTVDTYICELAPGNVVISGPLATKVAALRGLMLMSEGEGNPTVEQPHAQFEQTEWLPPAVNPGIAEVNAASKEAASQPPLPEVGPMTTEGMKRPPPPGEPVAGKLQPEKAIAAEKESSSSSTSTSDSDNDPLATKVEAKTEKKK